MAKKLKKYQSAGPVSPIVNKDIRNNELLAYFNSLERSDPGPMGDGPPSSVKPVVTGNTKISEFKGDGVKAYTFKDGGWFDGLGKSKWKPKKDKKPKKSKPNRKTGLY